MANINTLSENVAQLTSTVNDTLSLISGYGKSSSSANDSVEVTLEDGTKVTMPSYQNLTKRVERAEKTVEAFVKGEGVAETDDGTFRHIKAEAVPKAPASINHKFDVTTFATDTNWFFEDLMFPKCVVKIDLKDYISDDSDRVVANRIILDYSDQDVRQFYYDNIAGKDLTYAGLIDLLNANSIAYSEDTETLDLPLSFEQFSGEFVVNKIAMEAATNDVNRLWYYLDTLNYKQVDQNGLTMSSAYILSVEDLIRYKDSLYKISKIDQAAKKIAIEYNVGYDTPAVGNAFSVYNKPFQNKIANIGIGYDEIDIVYLKGVNDNFNIVSKDWSLPIEFVTNELTIENGTMKLADYYKRYVLDFGADMIASAKQGTIYAYNGKTPNTPVIDKTDLKVVQINTQLEATLSSDEYNDLTSQIYTTKSTIGDLKRVIAENKEALITYNSADQRKTIEDKITTDSNNLSKYTTQYNSLIEQLKTLLNTSGAIGYEPKYHIRGFFPIPDPQYTDPENMIGKQDIIAFEIMYRYIHTDGTGVSLDTFEYTDEGQTKSVNAVFSDWTLVQSKVKDKVYNSASGVYEWSDESVNDGEQININQIDIPIRNGERVQFKVRSISEAGYPANPLKSEWCDIIEVEFPKNLTANDAVTTVLDTVKDEVTAVVLQETLASAGLYTHISDSNTAYKHDSAFISYVERKNNAVNTYSLEDYIKILVQKVEGLTQRIEELEQAQP